MERTKPHLPKVFGYLALLILLNWGLQNLRLLGGWASGLVGLFAPFILGLVVAYILNVPMSRLEKLLFKNAGPRLRPFARVISLVLTLLLVVGLLFVVLFLVVPELTSSIDLLGKSIPGYVERLGVWATQLAQKYPQIGDAIASINLNWGSILEKGVMLVQNAATSLLNSTVNVAAGIFNGILSFVLAIIFAIYALLQKDQLGQQAVQILRAFMPQKRADRVMEVLALTNRTFTSFISGQCLEAVILGLLFFITMSIVKLPYALMISVLIGVTALIPVVGAFIGCAVGVFVILMVNPIQALFFLGLFLLLQQVEGNLIYPRVVGSSIGLPAIWVLLAVTVGGSSMGIVGMLIFIPICSVLYTLLWQAVEKRRAIPVEETVAVVEEEMPGPQAE